MFSKSTSRNLWKGLHCPANTNTLLIFDFYSMKITLTISFQQIFLSLKPENKQYFQLHLLKPYQLLFLLTLQTYIKILSSI